MPYALYLQNQVQEFKMVSFQPRLFNFSGSYPKLLESTYEASVQDQLLQPSAPGLGLIYLYLLCH